MAEPKPLAEGFSADGYILDQDCFSSVRYRSMPASINGCGWIAAFDLLHFLSGEKDWDSVRRALDEGHRIRMPGPTMLPVMRSYLLAQIPGLQEVRGREAALAAAGESAGGIFRYREAGVPHYVSFLRQGDGLCRFFNVADGLEDCRMSLEDFGREHLKGGSVVEQYTIGAYQS